MKGFLGLYVDEADLTLFQPGSTVQIGGHSHVVREIRKADRGYQIAFEEVPDRESAESIRNLDVLVTQRRTLSDREYWLEDLVGLQVRPGGGEVVDVEFGPAQDRLVIEREGRTFEVPFVDPLVPVIDIEGGFVEIVEIEGLSEPRHR